MYNIHFNLSKERFRTMHKAHSNSQVQTGPKTTGATIHTASKYDLHTSLMGLGVNRSNSRMIVEMAKIKSGDTVLDVGCGSGNLTLTSAKYTGRSGSVYGIDAAPEMIEVARTKAQRHGLSATFEVALIESLPYPDAKFDAVISRLVIHHLPDDLKRRGFAEVLRVLKPGGAFFVADFKLPTNPLLAHLSTVFFGHGKMVQSNPESIVPILTQTGFIDVTSGPTRSVFLEFVSARKPTS
jgi:demethylmenaquinone methyltransferase/2-methoxy-6-polyprenyl-1,4-benzoquinol methylase/phosphoethanolamine N-methyltransferase